MTMAELVALREAISFADFSGDLPNRDEGEARVLSDFLRTADALIPELGTDAYGPTVDAAWRSIVGG